MSLLINHEPKPVWKYFEEISAIPHGSSNCAGIKNYLTDFAEKFNLRCISDEWNNVIIIKESSERLKDKETIIIQGHTDMVCEKDPDIDFDFEKDPLNLYIDGDFLAAHGTTLGADDGIAVAIGLALLASDIPLPRIELVLTSDEEIGMIGASNLDTSVLTGKKLINIDSEMDGVFVAGCAGASRMDAHISLEQEKMTGTKIKFIFKGFKGGHSGAEIHERRANAHIICAKVLLSLSHKTNFHIFSICGGTKDNAIPNYITVDALISDDIAVNELLLSLHKLLDPLKKYFVKSDPQIDVDFTHDKTIVTTDVLTKESQLHLLETITNINDGVMETDPNNCNIVITSSNNGILQLNNGECNIGLLVRSMISNDQKKLLNSQIDYFSGKNFTCKKLSEYSGWSYDSNSKLLNTFLNTYKELFDKEACAMPMHIGVECGIFTQKIPGLDCISLGPDIFDIHTPREKLSISSVQRCWQLIVTAISKL